jgi:hypothetical protein
MRNNYKYTSHRRVFKFTRFDKLGLLKCPLCSPHKGCNRLGWHAPRNWKYQNKKRKQWMP